MCSVPAPGLCVPDPKGCGAPGGSWHVPWGCPQPFCAPHQAEQQGCCDHPPPVPGSVLSEHTAMAAGGHQHPVPPFLQPPALPDAAAPSRSPPTNTCILGWLRPPRQLTGLQGCLPLPSRSRSARAGGFRSRSVPKPPPINLPPSPAPSPPRWAASWGGSIHLGSVQTRQLELGVCRHLLQVAGHRRGCCLHI